MPLYKETTEYLDFGWPYDKKLSVTYILMLPVFFTN